MTHLISPTNNPTELYDVLNSYLDSNLFQERIHIHAQPGMYNLGEGYTIPVSKAHRILITGDGANFFGTGSTLLKINSGINHTISGINFHDLQPGQTAIHVDTLNRSGAQLIFDNLEISGNDGGTGLLINNRSGNTTIKHLKSHKVFYPIHILDGDSVTIESPITGVPVTNTYQTGDGLFRIDRGMTHITNPMFMGSIGHRCQHCLHSCRLSRINEHGEPAA